MKVTITYYDDTALSIEEVLKRAKDNYGEHIDVDIHPTSSSPMDIIYFGLQQLVTHDQLSLLFDNDHKLYKEKVSQLSSKILESVKQELAIVIKDNEEKVS